MDWVRKTCKVLIVTGLCTVMMAGLTGCGFMDWLTGTTVEEVETVETKKVVDPETGEVTVINQPVITRTVKTDAEGSPLALVAGLLGFTQIGTGVAGLYGAARGKKWKKMGAAGAKTARRIWDNRTKIKDAEGKERTVILAETAADFFGEFAADQDKAEIRAEARKLIHLVENGSKAGKKLTGDA